MDHVEMRQRNAALTVETLYRKSPLRVGELRSELGLSRRTLDLILDDLIGLGWVEAVAAPAGGERSVGRPARLFGFRYDVGVLVAVQIEARHLRVTIADLAGRPRAEVRRTVPIDTDRDTRLRLLDESVSAALADAQGARDEILAVTVSTPGIVRDDGTVSLPMTIPGWTGFSLTDAIGAMFRCPVMVENDAKLAALGEKWSREGDVQDFVYLFSESERMGVGLVLDDDLRRGRDGAAGEVSWAPALGLGGVNVPLLRGLEDEESSEHERAVRLVADARAGGSEGLEEVQRLASRLIPAVTTISWLIAPEEIILGGTLGSVQDMLVPAIERELASMPFPAETRISGSRFGDRAIVSGCLRMCSESVRASLAALPAAPGAEVMDESMASGE